MSRQKLTIVVTCSHRKVAEPNPALMVRNLPAGTPEERVRMWRELLERYPDGGTPLISLYRGETWFQVKRLIAVAESVGYVPDLYVTSAGLGTRRIEESAPPYGATFSMGYPDSVARSVPEDQAWWAGLPHAVLPGSSQPSIWVLSEAYARVIGGGLASSLSDNSLVFGGSSDIPPARRVPADGSLRRALGGTVTSLNVRMAIQWLELAHGRDLVDPDVRQAWEAWCLRERHHETYDRQPLSDGGVRDFVAALDAKEPGISKTRALKALRAAGFACEQRRFGLLFEEEAVR